MKRRGGPQWIPRPEGARLGDAAPWAHLGTPTISIAGIETALARRGAGAIKRPQPTEGHRRSAVLIALYDHDDEPWVVLTRRSPRLRSHTREVSFPGGRVDPVDHDDWATARREAHEEVDLDPDLPRQIGRLDSFITGGSQTFVSPIVAELLVKPDLTANEDEVERILHVSLSELLLPEVFREEVWPIPDVGMRTINFFELHGDTVWGATASMLRQLLGIATGTDDLLRH